MAKVISGLRDQPFSPTPLRYGETLTSPPILIAIHQRAMGTEEWREMGMLQKHVHRSSRPLQCVTDGCHCRFHRSPDQLEGPVPS